MKKLFFSAVVCMLFFSSWTHAQVGGKITGTVVDSLSGEGLAFASVSLVNASGKTVNGALTDDDGAFVIENVAPGTYQLQAVFIGYTTKTSDKLEFKKGQAALDVGILSIARSEEHTSELQSREKIV